MIFKKSVMILSFLTILSFGAETDSAKDSVPNGGKVAEVKPVDDSLKIVKNQLDSLKKKDLANKDELQKMNDSIKVYKTQIDSLKKEIGKKEEIQKKQSFRLSQVDTMLVKVATISLYLPFDSVSVETRAIPAYKLISDSALSKKHEIRLKMLESYRNDVIEFQKFMQKMMTEFKSKKVSKNRAEALAKKLKEQKFFKNNQEYNGVSEGTFMGNLFRETLEQLQRYSNENTADFYKVMLELDKCVGVGKN